MALPGKACSPTLLHVQAFIHSKSVLAPCQALGWPLGSKSWFRTEPAPKASRVWWTVSPTLVTVGALVAFLGAAQLPLRV